MIMTELLQAYSTRPGHVRLSFGTESWNSTPGVEARHLPANVLGLTGSVMLAKCDIPGVGRKKADKFKKKSQLYALTYRHLPDGELRATEHTPNLTGVLSSIPDCAHSHLVLELNVLAYLLKLPASVALGCWAHTPSGIPELITVQRVPDLVQSLLNDAYVIRRNQAAAGDHDRARVQALSGGQLSRGHNPALHAGTLPAPTGNPSPEIRIGRGGDVAHRAAPGGTAPVQPAPQRRLQQQSLF